MALLMFLAAPTLAVRALAAPRLTADLQLSCALMIFSSIGGVQIGALAGLEAFTTIAWVSLIRGAAGGLGLIVGTACSGVHGGVAGLVIAEALGTLAGHPALVRECARRGVRIAADFRRSELSILWTFSLPALLGSVSTMPALWLTKVWLVTSPSGYVGAGLYEAAQKWTLLILFLPNAIAPVQLPLLTSLHHSGDWKEYWRLLRANLLLLLALCGIPAIGIALAARHIMAAFGKDFTAGSTVLVIAAFTAIPSAFNTTLGQALVSRGGIWMRFAFDLLLAVFLLIAAHFLVPSHGAAGLAAASFVAYAVTCLGLAASLFISFSRSTRPAFRPELRTAGVLPTPPMAELTGECP
jgi:O-antigen/teichoic acid export membrane protein